jgi:hypothetical protein
VVAVAVGESSAVTGFAFARGAGRMRSRVGRWVGCVLEWVQRRRRGLAGDVGGGFGVWASRVFVGVGIVSARRSGPSGDSKNVGQRLRVRSASTE